MKDNLLLPCCRNVLMNLWTCRIFSCPWTCSKSPFLCRKISYSSYFSYLSANNYSSLESKALPLSSAMFCHHIKQDESWQEENLYICNLTCSLLMEAPPFFPGFEWKPERFCPHIKLSDCKNNVHSQWQGIGCVALSSINGNIGFSLWSVCWPGQI